MAGKCVEESAFWQGSCVRHCTRSLPFPLLGCFARRKTRMWILVKVVKGSKYFEPETQVDNHVLLSDTSEMVISARSSGDATYRFEVRRGNENFILAEYTGAEAKGSLTAKFIALATKIGAISMAATPTAV